MIGRATTRATLARARAQALVVALAKGGHKTRPYIPTSHGATSIMTWSETILQTLKDNDVRLVAYVPDNVLTPLLKGVTADNYFMAVGATREDEALGIVAGAWMGGMKGCVMMQTSGFGVTPNTLASLIVPFQIPAIMIISERGTLGEFNSGQVLVARTMRPVLDSVAVTHHTLTDATTLRFIVDKSVKQAVATQAPVALILSPLLTGGNPAAEAKLKT